MYAAVLNVRMQMRIATMTKRIPPVEYPGDLSTPLERHPSYDLLDPLAASLAGQFASSKSLEGKMLQRIEAAADHLLNAKLKKCPALFEYYGIGSEAPDRWQMLAVALATDHVTGFQIESKDGRTPQILGFDLKLWAEVRAIQIEHAKNVTEACKIFWKQHDKKGTTATIRRRFTSANKIWGEIFEGQSDEELKASVLDCVLKFPERAA